MPDNITTGSLTIRAAALRSLYRDWDARRAGRRFPARAAFDPLDLRYILGNLSLVDVRYSPLRFFFRLHASNNVMHLGVDLTGKELAAMPEAAEPDHVRAQYELAVRNRAPQARWRSGTLADGERWEREVLVLPLAADGETIDMLMVGTAWTAR